MLGLLVHTEWLHFVCSYLHVYMFCFPPPLLVCCSYHFSLLLMPYFWQSFQWTSLATVLSGTLLCSFCAKAFHSLIPYCDLLFHSFGLPTYQSGGSSDLSTCKLKVNICSLFSVPILGLHYDDDGDYYYCYCYNLLKVTLAIWKSKSIGWLLKRKNILKQLWSCHWNGIITFQKLKLLSCYKKKKIATHFISDSRFQSLARNADTTNENFLHS